MDQGFPKFELEQVFRSDAADILAAREKARIMHHGRDIRAAGDEVEMAFRRVLRRKLPLSYYVGHGHIVDQELHQSSQLDVVIADNAGTPVLLQAENGSEYFPYEGVYAIGEVKSSYDNSEKYIHAFSDNLKRIQDQLNRESFQAAPTHGPSYESILYPFRQPYGNPLFSFMFFANAGDFRIEQVLDLYQTRSAGELPNVVCILNKGVIINTLTLVVEGGERQNWEPLQSAQPGAISLIPAYNDNYPHPDIQFHWVLIENGINDKSLAANFATLYFTLTDHLQHCQLTAPNLTEYTKHIFDMPTSTVIS